MAMTRNALSAALREAGAQFPSDDCPVYVRAPDGKLHQVEIVVVTVPVGGGGYPAVIELGCA
jgi:hypothetical protein